MLMSGSVTANIASEVSTRTYTFAIDFQRHLRLRFFGRIRKRICDPRSYGFFDTKETQNPKKDYFVITRQAGGTQYINQNDISLFGIQIIYKQGQYLQ